MGFPDMVRFALLSRGSFFVFSLEAVAKRLGGAGEIIEEKQGKTGVNFAFLAFGMWFCRE